MRPFALLATVLALLPFTACGNSETHPTMSTPAPVIPANAETLVLGGGCFWCVEAAYELIPGVVIAESGYAGGKRPNPSYEQVCTGATGHAEVVKITFDPAQVTRAALLDFFWDIHNPTTLNREGADEGTQYRSVIYYANDAEKTAIEASRDRANPAWGGKIITEISPLPEFYVAEAYHQDYFRKNPGNGYCQAVIRPKIEKLRHHSLATPAK